MPENDQIAQSPQIESHPNAPGVCGSVLVWSERRQDKVLVARLLLPFRAHQAFRLTSAPCGLRLYSPFDPDKPLRSGVKVK